jgi:hypothetical protein
MIPRHRVTGDSAGCQVRLGDPQDAQEGEVSASKPRPLWNEGGLMNTPKREQQAAREETFAREMEARLRRSPGVLTVQRLGGMKFHIKRAAGEPLTMNLRSLYGETRNASPVEREAQVNTWLRVIDQAGFHNAGWAEAQTQLRPSLRGMSWLAARGAGAEQPAHRPFLPFVVRVLALDLPDCMAYATESELASWDMPFEAAEAQAVKNLTKGPMTTKASTGHLVVTGPYGYISSWLAVPGAFDFASEFLGGPVVAFAPTIGDLCFASLRDSNALTRTLTWADEAYEAGPRRLSPVPYCKHADRIIPWRPPRDHPDFNQVAKAERHLAYFAYEEQRAALQDAQDAFVASLMVFEDPDGSVQSVATWTKGVDKALLPIADVIAFMDLDTREPITVAWDDARALLPDLMEPVEGMEPARVRITEWPGDRLSQLRALATI